MKCQECSELLLDYIHGELNAQDSARIKEHISGCERCTKELEEFSLINMAAQKEELPEVSSEVLSKISDAATKAVAKDKTPFWKKWSYTPILAPALTTAIALSVWFYYGHNVIDISPDVAMMKTPAEGAISDSEYGTTMANDNIVIEDNLVLEEQDEFARSKEFVELEEESESRKPDVFSAAPPPPPSESEGMPELEHAGELERTNNKDTFQESELLSKANEQDPSSQKQGSNDFEIKRSDTAKSRAQDEQGLFANKKTESECDVSIRTNLDLLNSSVPQSKSAQQRSYKELAECYEQKKDYDKAITNYMNLQQVAPEETSYANSRIQMLQNRIRLYQLEKKEMSEPVPSN